VSASDQRVEVTWDEIAPNTGRRITVDSLVAWDPDSSSVMTLGGEYVGECDYRLFVQRIAEGNGFGLGVRITGKLYDQLQAVGTALAIDTVRVTQPNTPVPFDASVAPNLTVSLTSNINPAPPLGTIPVTIGGLNTNVARSSTYVVRALNSVTNFPVGSDSLVVRVVGPTTENDSLSVSNPPAVTLVIRPTTGTVPIMNGMTIAFGSGSTAAGDSAQWSARWIMNPVAVAEVNLEAYEGYHIWRSDTPDLEAYTLLGEIQVCTSKSELAVLDPEEAIQSVDELHYDPANRRFRFVDLDVHNDFPFRYAVSTFDRGFLGNEFGLAYEGERIPSDKLYPGRNTRNASQEAYVVPNPYVKSADWEEGGEAKVVFTNLPESCTIRVFTEAADHLATIQHGPTEPRSTSPTTVTWNLKSESGENIVPGVYIYYIEGPNFQQTGKMMVAR
jgi:hypothetical protein